MSSDDSDHEGGRGGMDFAAIDSQANVNLSLEEANKLHRQKLMGAFTQQAAGAERRGC